MTYSHTEQPSNIMFQLEILVGKGLRAVDAGAACAVAVEEVSALDHEVFDLGRGSVDQSKSTGHLRAKRQEGLTTRWNLLPL